MVEETLTSSAPGKLSADIQEHVCRKLAAFQGPAEICAWLMSEHQIKYSEPGILHYRDSKAWSDRFARYRADWQANTKDMFLLANVSGRIDELRKLYADAYKELKGATKAERRSVRSELRLILEQIQTEIPGVGVTGEGATLTIELPDWYQDRQPEAVPAGNK